MRNILIMIMFAASLADAARANYEEVRDLTLAAQSIDGLHIEAGAGSLTIAGVTDSDRIVVKAVITVPHSNADKASDTIRKHMTLSLEKKDGSAELRSFFDSGFSLFGDSPSIHLEVFVPKRMALEIKDGSGSVEIRDVSGDIDLDDGSGSIKVIDAGGGVKVKDGSGSLVIDGAGGDVAIVDGSGSISLKRVAGSAVIKDGSGSIEVAEVGGDLTIPEAGSGSVDVRDVHGRFETAD